MRCMIDPYGNADEKRYKRRVDKSPLRIPYSPCAFHRPALNPAGLDRIDEVDRRQVCAARAPCARPRAPVAYRCNQLTTSSCIQIDYNGELQPTLQQTLTRPARRWLLSCRQSVCDL